MNLYQFNRLKKGDKIVYETGDFKVIRTVFERVHSVFENYEFITTEEDSWLYDHKHLRRTEDE